MLMREGDIEQEEYQKMVTLQNYIEKNQTEEAIQYIDTKMEVKDILSLRFTQNSKTSITLFLIFSSSQTCGYGYSKPIL